MGCIDATQVARLAAPLEKSGYGRYLLRICEEDNSEIIWPEINFDTELETTAEQNNSEPSTLQTAKVEKSDIITSAIFTISTLGQKITSFGKKKK